MNMWVILDLTPYVLPLFSLSKNYGNLFPYQTQSSI